MLVWLVNGIDDASDEGKDCGADELCQNANDLGTAIGAGFILFIWVAGAVILGVIWLVTNKSSGRPARRPPDSPPPPARW
ncbi:hypothetical protein [Streptomyces sp. 4F14]|uniref:hypothetical protein n=1 Tax=Streptomyces sp. 4F14 TaxID=3394380 RepID=UPI003A8596CD